MILRILLGVMLICSLPAQTFADCAELLGDLSELEVDSMKKAAFEMRKALDHPHLDHFNRITKFIATRYHAEALDSIPLVIPALLMRTDSTREEIQLIMSWMQHAEHQFLTTARDDIVGSGSEERFFRTLMNINKLREPLDIDTLQNFINDVEESDLKVGDEDMREWLGERYRHLSKILRNVNVPFKKSWDQLKRDLLGGMDPEAIAFARYFLTMAILNVEMLDDEKLWAFSAFAKLPESGIPNILGVDDLVPMTLEEDSYQRFLELFGDREGGDEDEDLDLEAEPWLASVNTYKPDRPVASDSHPETYDHMQARLLHELVIALAYVGEGIEAEDADAAREVQEVLNDWELAAQTLNAPTMIEHDVDWMLTPVQAAYYWDRAAEKNAILRAMAEKPLPFWMLPPCEPVTPAP